MKHRWLVAWGWFYRPGAWQGFVAVTLTLAFCVQVFLTVDHLSYSVSDSLYGIFPYIVPSLVLLNWLASRTSADPLGTRINRARGCEAQNGTRPGPGN